jgi:amino acid permease
MARLKNKVQNVLDESRMLVLGAQVLLGFQFRSLLEKGFESLPITSQFLSLCALGLMLVALALLISPSSYHRLVERGEDTDEIHRYASRVLCWALLPFALGLSIDLYVAAQKIIGWKTGAAVGLLSIIIALFFWYALELYGRRERADEITEEMRKELEVDREKDAEMDAREKLSNKIKHVLTEARVVLPGAQALLGFQFIACLMEGFDKLPTMSKYIHLTGLGLIALTIILLMTPAAYHRIVERGEETEHFHRFASKMVVAALVPLALGLCGDVYVVVQKVTSSQLVSVVAALITLAIFWELWFGLTLYRRTQREYAS